MPRYLPRAFCAPPAAIVVLFLSVTAPIARGQEPSEPLLGRLAFVEPAARRIAVIPDGRADLVELIVEAGGEIRNGDRELTLSELVILVGRRVNIRYRLDSDRLVAQSVIVESEESAPLPAPARPPTRQR